MTCENHRMSEASPSSPDAPHPESAAAREEEGAAALPGRSWLAEELSELDAERPPRPSKSKVVTAGLSGALVIGLLAWALPWATGASWGEIAGALSALPVWAVPVMALLGIGALLLESLTVRAALPGSRWSPVLLGHAASGATALAVPGGSLLGLGLMGWILRRAGLALPFLVTGLIAASLVEMVITSVLIPLIGLGAYALSSVVSPMGIALPGALWAALLAVLGAGLALAMTALLLRRSVLSWFLDRSGESIPGHVAAQVLEQRDALMGMLRGCWPGLSLPTVGARLLQWFALLLAIEVVGADVPLLLTVAIFALGRVLSLVPLTPGGAGVTEAVGGAALVALGVGAAQAASAMLLLLVTMLLVPLLCGALATVLAFTLAPGRPPR